MRKQFVAWMSKGRFVIKACCLNTNGWSFFNSIGKSLVATSEYVLFVQLLLFLIVMTLGCSVKDSKIKSGSKIVIEGEISPYFYRQLLGVFTMRDDMKIQYAPFRYFESTPPVQVAEEPVINRKIKWTLYSEEPLLISPPMGATFIANPGDTIHINYTGGFPVYSGKIADKYKILNQLMEVDLLQNKPNKKNSYNARSLKDFLEWNTYLDNKLTLQIPVVDFYKDKLLPYEYEYYKIQTVGNIESDRIRTFEALVDSCHAGPCGLSASDLNTIWDTTQYKPWGRWLRSISNYQSSVENIYAFNRMEVWRQFGFNYKNDSLNSHDIRTCLYYNKAKQQYKGLLRERLLAYILDEQTIMEMGLKNSITQALLKDYYSQPGFPEYKKWVRGLEEKAKKLTKN
jgi:hypothetical protein